MMSMRPLHFRVFLYVFIFVNFLNHGAIGDDSNSTIEVPLEDVDAKTQLFFINHIFAKYGHNQVMQFEGFEHLMENLGLGGLIIKDHTIKDHKNEKQKHDNHDHGININYTGMQNSIVDLNEINSTIVSFIDPMIIKELFTGNLVKITNPEKHDNECLSPSSLLEAFNLDQFEDISVSTFLHLCPAILYELDENHCKTESVPSPHIHPEEAKQQNRHKGTSKDVWLYASLAILVISLCGLLSVAAVPLMHKAFYNQLLKFLVALAVGTLTGDALLHLIPHALAPNAHMEEEESLDAIWKGLTVLCGIYMFFLMERIIMLISGVCKKSKEKKSNALTGLELTANDDSNKMKKYDLYSHADQNVTLQLLTVAPSSNSSKQKDKNLISSSNEKNILSVESQAPPVVIEHKQLGHGHGHSHEVPKSLSAVVYMVIMGDGFHNFTDGLAIGAAFAANITGGLSTSIAVFCHELPHELGDFAVLLKSGMTARQAIFYNCLSSVCCFVGMLIGVALGNLESASDWIFAAAAGMFIYISLVDMVPQLSTSEEIKPSHILLQFSGMASGIGLMLLIALYEQDLKKAIDS